MDTETLTNQQGEFTIRPDRKEALNPGWQFQRMMAELIVALGGEGAMVDTGAVKKVLESLDITGALPGVEAPTLEDVDRYLEANAKALEINSRDTEGSTIQAYRQAAENLKKGLTTEAAITLVRSAVADYRQAGQAIVDSTATSLSGAVSSNYAARPEFLFARAASNIGIAALIGRRPTAPPPA